ncbi:beta-ketoacyl-ACP reductase [Kurthia zopfii]|uniref:3-oxoacyl-[acyl-carrier protein] reductase n=1 Tax=Kurthia zopfii TaxID=1650 RepID=A0A8B4Q690_9BACL|nr:SDR family oxidoreductase [Kurthia zopfii]PWI22645.1 3-oxoacyl-ACP reductase [Kurthia zopfii]TDR39253.1 3-oxoacyl-[acyl-carrier protein] reductase [Kurthia zopfii]GEK31431.1 beta-ketoacyl-ACP reductase [Kurthia zopfii]STX08798.1 3-oxoacyl-[acyl-carrier-protein] reductase FabG [Kurthia zopfii]
MELLIGKTALVTGSSGLIGKEIIKLFAENKSNIIACMRKKNPRIEAEFSRIAQENNVDIQFYYFDLEKIDEIKQFVMKLKKNKIIIDILINNAGFAMDTLAQLTTVSHLEKMMRINFYGAFELTKYVIKLMRKSKTPSIVNISSIASLNSYPGMMGYSISKSAINEFTKRLAIESSEIRSNAIAPGFIETEMLDKNITNTDFLKEEINQSCMKRLGKPEEVAKAVLFLSSDLASFITGQIIRVDGGAFRGL